MVVFGGCFNYRSIECWNITFAFDGANWTELNPQKSPPPRGGASMAYDPKLGHMLLFGGVTGEAPLSNETWALEVTA